uniref:Calpain I heavy chain (Fragments) n=1 Tax=Bos taurus TaxID=9913 RepID=Q7M2N3_BOVIN
LGEHENAIKGLGQDYANESEEVRQFRRLFAGTQELDVQVQANLPD